MEPRGRGNLRTIGISRRLNLIVHHNQDIHCAWISKQSIQGVTGRWKMWLTLESNQGPPANRVDALTNWVSQADTLVTIIAVFCSGIPWNEPDKVNQSKTCGFFTCRRGGLVVNTLAYHTGDPGSIPGRGCSSENVRVSEVISHLPPATLQAWYGGIQKGLVGTGELSVFALFPVTRHNKELVEAQPWTNRSITHPPAFTAHMHTQVEGGH